MSITLTSNYTEVLAAETVEKIQELLEDSYCLDDILEFIDQYNEADFMSYYEEYVTAGENIGNYDVVDTFVEEMGDISYVEHVEDAYRGRFDSFKEYAEQTFDDLYLHQIPENLHSYIDYDKFADDLEYDYLFANGYVFDKNF